MALKHYRDNFLFARAKIAETPGVSQYVAYAVNPAPVEIAKGFYFPDTGVLALHAMHQSGKRLDAQPIYEGRATEPFREAVLDDAYRSDENPSVSVSYCVLEEYGLSRVQHLDEVPKHSLEIEFVELSEVVDFRFVEHMANTDDGKYRARYEVQFANDLTFPLDIQTVDDPALLEEVSHAPYALTVGGVVIDLDMQIIRFLRLYRWGGFDRDLFAQSGS